MIQCSTMSVGSKCTNAKCNRLWDNIGCYCTSRTPGEEFSTSETENLYQSWIYQLRVWTRKAGVKEYVYATHWKLDLKLKIMMYLHFGLSQRAHDGSSTYKKDNVIRVLTLQEMLPFFSFLNKLENENPGIDVIQQDAKAVLLKYRLRQYNITLQMQCRYCINYYIDRATCIKSGHSIVIERKENRSHLRETGKERIESLPIPNKLKKYLQSDIVELNDPDVPPAVYLIVEWFAKDSVKREAWDVFISKHYCDQLHIR